MKNVGRHHIFSLALPLFITFCLVFLASLLVNNHPSKPAFAATTYSVPSSIPSDCSSDATSALNSWIASLPADSTINMPTNGCYLVSNSTSDELTIAKSNGLVINGNNTTIKQTTFNYISCAQPTQPILTLKGNNNLTINNLVIDGPASGSGDCYEGDYGIWYNGGNNNMTFNGVTVENVDGDGIASFPPVSYNTIFENGVLNNIGYHGISLQGDVGFLFTNNTVTNYGNFADLEYDSDCSTWCWNSNGTPNYTGGAPAQMNVTISSNTYKNHKGTGDFLDSQQAPCVPQGNLVIKDNNLDSTAGMNVVLFGTMLQSAAQPQSCPAKDTGLQIVNNTSTGDSGSPCGGSIASPPACGSLSIMYYQQVNIASNTMVTFDGTPTYYPNTPYVPAVSLCGVSNGTVENNIFNDFYSPYLDSKCFDEPSNIPTNSGITDCNNTYWVTEPVNGVTADPKNDGACPVITSTPTTSTTSPSASTTTNTNTSTKVSSPSKTVNKPSTSTNVRQANPTVNKSTNQIRQNIMKSTNTLGHETTMQKLRNLLNTKSGTIIFVLIVFAAALATAYCSLMIWSQRWNPFYVWDKLIHKGALISNGTAAITYAQGKKPMKSYPTTEPYHSQSQYKPGDLITPKDYRH